jgi:hypothetical protein
MQKKGVVDSPRFSAGNQRHDSPGHPNDKEAAVIIYETKHMKLNGRTILITGGSLGRSVD